MQRNTSCVHTSQASAVRPPLLEQKENLAMAERMRHTESAVGRALAGVQARERGQRRDARWHAAAEAVLAEVPVPSHERSHADGSGSTLVAGAYKWASLRSAEMPSGMVPVNAFPPKTLAPQKAMPAHACAPNRSRTTVREQQTNVRAQSHQRTPGSDANDKTQGRKVHAPVRRPHCTHAHADG